jgi:hypothetical protein
MRVYHHKNHRSRCACMTETVADKKKWSGYNGDRPPKTTGSLEPIPGRCGTKLKFTGTGPENPPKYCKNWPSKELGGDRCRFCGGGRKNQGIANGRFKDGSQSRYLPKRMLADYEEAIADPNLISLRSDIAVVRARTNDLLKRVDSGEAGQIWRSLQDSYQDFKTARSAADPVKMQESLELLGTLIERGAADSKIWFEVISTIEQGRKLIDSELKRLQALQVYVDSGAVITMLTAIAIQLKEIIENRDLTVKEQLSRTQLMLSKFMGEAGDRQKKALD